MEWASYATDSLKPCRIFLARIKCLLLKSRLHFWTLYICLSSSSSSPFSSPVELIIFRCLKRCLNMGLPVRLSLVRQIGLRTLAYSNGMVEAHNVIRWWKPECQEALMGGCQDRFDEGEGGGGQLCWLWKWYGQPVVWWWESLVL